MEKKVYKALSPAQFNKLPIAKQRVAVAEDIIDAIRKKKYIANTGQYIGDVKIGDRTALGMNFRGDIQKELPKVKECRVCALGSCILSITKFKNKLQWENIGRTTNEIDNSVSDLLSTVFTPIQLSIIEVMFEGYYFRGADNLGRDNLGAEELSKEIVEKCKEFKEKYKTENKRLIAIMMNIITNKGEIVL